MKYTNRAPISTETKVAIGILALTVAVLAGGLILFKGKPSTGPSEQTILNNIDTNLVLSKDTVSPKINPKITGTGKGTATSSTSTAPIEVTEFMDYECPACAVQGEYTIKKLLELYGDRVTITRRILPVHGQPSIEIGRMVLASQEYGHEAYQKLHEKVFETQNTWIRMGTEDRVTFFQKLTQDLGMDYDKLVADGKSKYASQIDADKAAALQLNIRYTPSFIINYKTRINGGIPLNYIQRYIDIR